MTSNHTPTPWMECPVKAGDGTGHILAYEIIAPKVDGGEGEPLIVARCWTKEDMQAIVRAVNAYEDLKAVLDAAKAVEMHYAGGLFVKLRAAIAKAEPGDEPCLSHGIIKNACAACAKAEARP